MRSIAYKYEELRARVASGHYFREYFHERLLDFCEGRIENAAAGVEDNVPLRAERRAVQAECFAQPPFDAVANHGLADSPGDGKAQARTTPCSLISGARQTKRGKQRAGEADALVINFTEVGRAQNSGRPGEP